jgi:hypothetical protein
VTFGMLWLKAQHIKGKPSIIIVLLTDGVLKGFFFELHNTSEILTTHAHSSKHGCGAVRTGGSSN